MPSFQSRQESTVDTRRSASQGHLIIDEAPATAQSLIGQPLLGAGAITVEGTYVCYIDTHDWSTIEVVIKASAVTGTIACVLSRMFANGVAVRESAASVDVSTSVVEHTLTGLEGSRRCQVTFAVGASESMTFANTTPATPTSVAEFNGQ